MARDRRSKYISVGRPKIRDTKVVVRSYKYFNPIKNLVKQGYSISDSCERSGICRTSYYRYTNSEQKKELKQLRKKMVQLKLHY